jgi:predicted site-specific integrase-resolvase/DNA-binding XRE family transcriptional regulator
VRKRRLFCMRTSGASSTVAGSLLALARVRLNLTQRELAARSGVAQSTIARIESGRTDPGFESVQRILASVGLEPRIQLESLDDHDLSLLERHSRRSDVERQRVATWCHTTPRECEVMNLSEWANLQGIHPQTAYRWFREGALPVPARQVGRLILVGDLDTSPSQLGVTVIYARVFPSDQRVDLDCRVSRVSVWATAQGQSIDRVVTEVDSGLNAKRRKFLALLADPSVTTIVVEHRERFARFSSEYVAASLSANGRRLVVVDDAAKALAAVQESDDAA